MCLADLIARMLEYDPTKRISLAEAVNHPFFEPLSSHVRFPGSYHRNYPSDNEDRVKDLQTPRGIDN